MVFTLAYAAGTTNYFRIKQDFALSINEFLYNGSKWELGRTRYPFQIKILYRYNQVIYNQFLLYIIGYLEDTGGLSIFMPDSS